MKSISRDLADNELVQRLLVTFRGHYGSVNCVRWAKHDQYIVSGSDDL